MTTYIITQPQAIAGTARYLISPTQVHVATSLPPRPITFVADIARGELFLHITPGFTRVPGKVFDHAEQGLTGRGAFQREGGP
jgi:hypothetical protein